MLPKRSRFSVESFPKNAKTAFKGPHFTIKTIPGGGRVGVVIGKGKAKRAVLRNSLKRFIYNFFKDNPTSSNVDLLVLLNTSIMKLDSQKKQELKEELEQGLTKV